MDFHQIDLTRNHKTPAGYSIKYVSGRAFTLETEGLDINTKITWYHKSIHFLLLFCFFFYNITNLFIANKERKTIIIEFLCRMQAKTK